MKITTLSLMIALATLVVAACAADEGTDATEPGAATDEAPIALVGGMLIDGTGAEPVANSVVLLRGERIERVGTVDSLPIPDGYRQISTVGMTVMPGLFDPHVHLL